MKTETRQCNLCEGSGTIWRPLLGIIPYPHECHWCAGKGYLVLVRVHKPTVFVAPSKVETLPVLKITAWNKD